MPSPDEPSFIRTTWGSLKNALIGCSVAAIVGLVVLVMSLLSATSPRAAGEPTTLVATPAAQMVQYYLPYPGILPDNPLYKLKAARDIVSLWLTFNPTAKAQKELLYADKRIGAALALVEGGRSTLGASTASKAEKYLDQAGTWAIQDEKLGHDDKSFLTTLQTAAAKHLEILNTLESRVSGDDSQALAKVVVDTQLLQEKLQQALVGR